MPNRRNLIQRGNRDKAAIIHKIPTAKSQISSNFQIPGKFQ
jgi:hypothetical protein